MIDFDMLQQAHNISEVAKPREQAEHSIVSAVNLNYYIYKYLSIYAQYLRFLGSAI